MADLREECKCCGGSLYRISSAERRHASPWLRAIYDRLAYSRKAKQADVRAKVSSNTTCLSGDQQYPDIFRRHFLNFCKIGNISVAFCKAIAFRKFYS